MADCTYRFTDANGKERVIEGQAAFKAYLASGGLQHLMPNVAFSSKQTETPAFKKWFGDSKVVDGQGKPLVVYHATTKDFEAFDTSKVGLMGEGSWFSPEPWNQFIEDEIGGRIMPVYLALNNPKILDIAKDKNYFKKKALIEQGYDGVLLKRNGEIMAAVAFRPTQIKSAIGNTGAFDATNPDIRFSPRQDLKPEDVLKPGTVTKAREAIAKYKKAEPPDPLSAADRAHGNDLLKPLFAAAERNKPAFDTTLDKIAESVGGYAKKPGIKKPFRAVTKLATENGYDPATMKDLLRGTVVVETPEDAQRVIDEIGKVYKFDRIKNRLSIDLTDNKGETLQGKPLSTGYQDVLTNVVLDDGTVAEIQISTPGMLAAKNLGHEIYAFEREMPPSPVKAKMVDIQKQIYAEGANFGRAAQASNTRLNSALSTGSAFSRTSEGLRGEGAGSQAVAERQSGETVTGTSFQSKNMVPGAKESKSNFIGTSAPIISETGAFNRASQKNAAASRVEGTSADRFKRTEQLQQAVADLQEGKITRTEYNRMVDELRPVQPYAAVPAVTTPKDARYALEHGRGQSPEKAAKYGVPSMTLKKGDWAQLRLDIPSYQEHDAWVVSVHTPKSTNREVQSAYDAGPVVGYESVAALTDVTFGMNQKAAAKIATGSAKGTIATMLGKWSPISKEAAKARADAALNDPAWTQVGMDPFRHSYFYDRDTMRPVLSADEVIQVGPLVLAKNVEFGQDTDITGAPIMFSARQKPGFYSQLSRAISNVPDRLATMPAQQWKAWIDSNSAKLGVKKDEIEWSGIKDYLDLRGKDKVTRADLVDYLGQNGVQVTETVLSGDAGMTPEELQEMLDEATVWGDEDLAPETRQELLELPKYGQYTLPGGENYREVLLTLPSVSEGKIVKSADGKYRFKGADGEVYGAGYATEAEAEDAQNSAGVAYRSAHWAQPNVLAHIRVNDRTDADGKSVLFVEELQSDWGQEGKKKGFVPRNIETQLKEGEKRLEQLGQKIRGITNRMVAAKPGSAEWQALSEERQRLQDEQNKEIDWGNGLYDARASGIPTAPFVTKTEGWLNLALKRIAMMAVDGGYDKVAFVNGEQSHTRFPKKNNGESTLPGFQAFYDQIVPQAVNTLLPKLGGEKLGTVNIGESNNFKFVLRKPDGSLVKLFDSIATYDSRQAAQQKAKQFERGGEPGFKVEPAPREGGTQPGFDVTDKMRETVGQGLPMFSQRQPVGKETEGWLLSRDATGRFRFGAGAKAYRAAADVASNVLDLVGLKPVSPELSRAMRKMRMEIDKAQNLTVDVAKNMKDLPEQERQMVSDVIEGELKRGAKPPQRVLEIAATMQSIMSEQSAELVRLGMLSPGAAGRWDGKYLPRFYEQKLGDEAKAWMKAVKGLLGRKKTMQGIGGSSLKARGMFESVPVADLADWEAAGWEVRDDTFDPAVDDQITVWRDYTRKERDDMGEIRDSMFRFVMGYNKSQRDIALGRLYENLAANYASRTEQPGYVQVPATNVEDTFAKRYGKLAGKWVPAEILDQLVAFDTTMQNDLTKIYMKGLSMWKEGKTVLNPVAHANNILSNLTMAHFAGVSYWDGHKYVGAIKDLVKGDAMVDEAKEAGLFGGTFNRAELMDAMPEPLRALAQMSESKAKQSVDMIWNALSLWLRKPLGKAYAAEDDFFRYMIYRDARNKGLSPDDAVDYSLKYMFSYDDMPKGARFLRDMPLGLPFFAYTYKVVPALANTALEHPFRYAAPAVAIYTANAIMYSIAAGLGGGDDEDWWSVIQRYVTDPEFRQTVKDKEEQERKALPEWMKGASLALGTEKTIRLGMDDLTNLPVFLDVSRMFPGGDLFDAHNNAGGIPLLAPITPNSPILTVASAMLFNKDTFRGQDVVSKTDTSAEAAQKRLAWMWKQMTPAIAVGNTHFERAMNVIANVTGNPVNVGLAEYTGVGKDGVPITPGYAALQTVGIKARPIDLDTSEKIQKSQTKGLIRELDIQIKKLQRLENKGAISSDTAEAEKEKLREKKRNLKQGLTLEGEEKD